MSTESEPPSRTNTEAKADLDRLLMPRSENKAAQALVETQEENTAVKDSAREERFLWACACVVLFDCAIFMNADNFAGPVMVGVIELLALVILARRLGVEEVKELVYGLIDRVGRISKGD